MDFKGMTIADLAKMTPKQLEQLTPAERQSVVSILASGLGVKLETPQLGTIKAKAQPRGTISVYGFQKMPITLYPKQWDRFLDEFETVKEQVQGVRDEALANLHKFETDPTYKAKVEAEAAQKAADWKAKNGGSK